MLKKALVCVMLVAATAIAWESLDDVPYGYLGAGSAITYGDGQVWAIVPDIELHDATFFQHYNLSQPQWYWPDQDLPYLTNTAMTFKWRYGNEVFVIGICGGQTRLYRYDVQNATWSYGAITEFTPGTGVSLAFRPAAGYYGTYVAGWLYCMVGGGNQFWYKPIAGPGDQAIDGICPGETALVADNTPTFIWPAVQGAMKYRLTVSPNLNMSNPVLVDSCTTTTYEAVEELDNDTYYWQVAARQDGVWNNATIHSFTLATGWMALANLPVNVTYGGSMAYEKDFYNDEECLIALTGAHQYLDIYSVATNTWDDDITTPTTAGIGSAIVTHEAASSTAPYLAGPWAEFGEYDDNVYYHTNSVIGWVDYFDLPQSVYLGASLAYSIESGTPYLYLTIGQDDEGNPRNNFYRQELPSGGEGGEARPGHLASLPARVTSSFDKVTVEYELAAPACVRASVFDALGRQVRVLEAGPHLAGVHKISWDMESSGRRTSAGAYFILLDTGMETARLKAVVR
jgi:hypothetical protein